MLMESFSPPGSGKTKTIVAIVGALLTNSLRNTAGVAIIRPQQVNGSLGSQKPPIASKKLLVCAPSNAAVDELVMRLKQGVKTLNGDFHRLSIVRIGRSDNINTNVLDVTLEELVNAKLNLVDSKTTSTSDDIGKLMLDHKTACEEYVALRTKVEDARTKGQSATPEQDREFEVLKRKKQQLSNQIDLLKDSGNTVARNAEINRHRAQQEILNGADVVCATLSGSGHDMFQKLTIEFETVVIDEAAQSIELSALIPLKYGCAKCIMVGDPKQLPPTVLSREAARFQYEQSLFVRMQTNHPDDVHLLDTQYRMHPEISLFPSQAFYDGKLLDGPGMATSRTQPWHESQVLGPYRFFDVQGVHQSAPKGHSLINVAELEVALQLFDRLMRDYKGYDFKGKVGIITPYKSQLRELRARFAGRYGESIFKTIEFNTTDAFQGRESEVIIFSCVRAAAGRGIGFLSDIRRMNVGITRAKSSLWVLGNSQSLMQGEFWGRLIRDAKIRKCYIDGNIVDMLKKPVSPVLSRPREIVPSLPKQGENIDTQQDIDMTDAPTVNESIIKQNHHARKPVDTEMLDIASDPDSGKRPPTTDTSSSYRPSGGNGLNPLAMCDWCGSYEHVTRACDNEVAKKVGFRCYRCHDLGHSMAFCKAERCLECGELGHLANICTSAKVLSRSDKEDVRRLERDWKSASQKAPEQQRKKQVGSHDKSIPMVRATRKTPPPDQQFPKIPKSTGFASQKRKRDSSPPGHLPKDPRVESADAKTNGRSRLLHPTRADHLIRPSSSHSPASTTDSAAEHAASTNASGHRNGILSYTRGEQPAKAGVGLPIQGEHGSKGKHLVATPVLEDSATRTPNDQKGISVSKVDESTI